MQPREVNAGNPCGGSVGKEQLIVVGIFPRCQPLHAVNRHGLTKRRAKIHRLDQLLPQVVAVNVLGANAAAVEIALATSRLGSDELMTAAREQHDPGFYMPAFVRSRRRRHILAYGKLHACCLGIERGKIRRLRRAKILKEAHQLRSSLIGVDHANCVRRTCESQTKPYRKPEHLHAAFLTALTIFCAASSRSSAEMTLRPDLLMISLPSATLVPSSRTTSGTRKPTSLTAATTPSAMISQRMMPPKMLIKIPFTFGSDVMILNAAVTLSLLAPPPTSRKFAGVSP